MYMDMKESNIIDFLKTKLSLFIEWHTHKVARQLIVKWVECSPNALVWFGFFV